MNSTFLMVDSKIVPEIYLKVIEAKSKIASGKVTSANEAIKEVGISRSTFYKYKDSVFALSELGKASLVTLEFVLEDKEGVLSKILSVLADEHRNVLTINQNIPINDVANVTITFKEDDGGKDIDELIVCLKQLYGVNKVRIIAMN